MTKRRMVRQGDVLLVPVDDIPPGAEVARDARGRLVLAEGEVTGHAHVILDEGAIMTESEQGRFLRIVAGMGVDLAHEEHGTIHLAPGSYRQVPQYEYDPVEARRVLD